MIRRFVPAAAFAAVLATTLLGVRLMAEPEAVDARSCIPGNAWLYAEFGPGQTSDWKEYLFGGLPQKDREEAEKALDDLWKEFAETSSKALGTDVGTFVKEIDRVHYALLDFKIVQTVRGGAGPGQGWESTRPELDMVAAIKSKSKGFFGKLLEGDFKKFVEAGEDYKTRKTWVFKTGASETEKSVSKVYVAAVGDVVFLSNVRGSLEKMLEAADGGTIPGGTITANPDFQRAQKAAGKNPLILGFVNLQTVFQAVEASLDRDDLRSYQMVDAVAGQSTLRSAFLFSGLEGKYSWSGGSLFLDPKNELWSILKQTPAKKDLLRFIPASCIGATVFTLNHPAETWEKLHKFIQNKIDQLGEERDKGKFQAGMDRFEHELGASIADILAVVDDEIGWCGLVPEGGRFDEHSQVVYVELKDVDKAKALIDSIRNGSAVEEMGGEITSREYSGQTLYTFEGGNVPVGYMILDKVFVLTFSPDVQTAIVDAYKSGKVLENDAQYKASMKRLPNENSKLVYYNAGAVMRMVAEMSREVDPDVAEKLKGKGDQGVAIVTVEKADEASLLAGAELNSEYYASIIEAALPAIRESREKAKERAAESKLSMLQYGFASWVNQKGDGKDYPTSLQALVDDGTIGAYALKGDANSPDPKYGYFFPPKGFGTDGTFVLVVDNEPFADGRQAVLRFSGTVDVMGAAEVKEALAKQDTALVAELEEAITDAKTAVKSAEAEAKEALEAKVKFLEGYKKEVDARVKK
ncbi:MAG: hypothetical protein K8T20_05625 [Planctomycetes bacterium]|nr:hypothetical protein [Planctomycetota bacterium]